MKLTFLLPIGVVLSTFFISCQKKSDNSTPTPNYSQNVVGTFYNVQTTININTKSLASSLSLFPTLSIPGIDTTITLGNYNTQFKTVTDASDATKIDFQDTNKVNPTILFYANGFTGDGTTSAFNIPSQSISSSLLTSLSSISGISSYLSSNPITIQGIANYTFNNSTYDGGFNNNTKLLTAYAKGQLNLSLGISLPILTLTITGTKQ
jgi:hypothetical protein